MIKTMENLRVWPSTAVSVLLVATLLAGCGEKVMSDGEDHPTTFLAPSLVISGQSVTVSDSGITDADGVALVEYTLTNSSTNAKLTSATGEFDLVPVGNYILSTSATVYARRPSRHVVVNNSKTTPVVISAVDSTVPSNIAENLNPVGTPVTGYKGTLVFSEPLRSVNNLEVLDADTGEVLSGGVRFFELSSAETDTVNINLTFAIAWQGKNIQLSYEVMDRANNSVTLRTAPYLVPVDSIKPTMIAETLFPIGGSPVKGQRGTIVLSEPLKNVTNVQVVKAGTDEVLLGTTTNGTVVGGATATFDTFFPDRFSLDLLYATAWQSQDVQVKYTVTDPTGNSNTLRTAVFSVPAVLNPTAQ